MPSKSQLQNTLKDKYGINKNITQSLSPEDCEGLLQLLSHQPSAARLVAAFTDKNYELSKNNRHFGQQRSRAEKQLQRLQAEHQDLQQAIAGIEKANAALGDRKQLLSEEQQNLETTVENLTRQNQNLSSKVQTLTTENDELVKANSQLKQDNKELKTVVDQIRLRLARDTKMLLQYEDSEIRKALIRLFRWTLG